MKGWKTLFVLEETISECHKRMLLKNNYEIQDRTGHPARNRTAGSGWISSYSPFAKGCGLKVGTTWN